MKARLLGPLVLVLILIATLGAVGTAAQGSGSEGVPNQGASDQPAHNVELAGQIGGSTYAVAVQGIHAYIGVGLHRRGTTAMYRERLRPGQSSCVGSDGRPAWCCEGRRGGGKLGLRRSF